MNTIFKCLLSICLFCIGFSLTAGTYFTEEDSIEGLRRGITDPITHGIGNMYVEYEGTHRNIAANFSNGVLVTPNKFLTAKHSLTAGAPQCILVSFHPDTNLVFEAFTNARMKGLDFESSFLEDATHTRAEAIAAMGDVSAIDFQPTSDLAMITLLGKDFPFHMPLYLEPILEHSWHQGLIVSYSSLSINGSAETLVDKQRHVAALHLCFKNVTLTSGEEERFLIKYFSVNITGDTKTFQLYPPEEPPYPLLACTKAGDSGAPFIINNKIMGLCSGIEILKDPAGNCYHRVQVIPLVETRDWLKSYVEAILTAPPSTTKQCKDTNGYQQ